MQAGDEAVDDRLGDQVEAGNAGEHRRIEKALHIRLPDGGGMRLEQAAQNFVRIDAVRFRVEIQQDAMAQDGDRQRGDVLVGHVIAAARQRAGLGGQHEELRGADAGAVVDVLLDEVRAPAAVVARGAHQIDDVARDRFGDRHHAHQLLEIENLLGVGDRVAPGRREWWWSGPRPSLRRSAVR